jgi:2-octaprenylphenol hydroxylase
MTRGKHEVIVVGGGVVGAATALALFRQGFDVALVERAARPALFKAEAWDPRVYALSPGSVRFLDALGVWNRIEAQRASAYERMQVWEQEPAQGLSFDAAELGVPELGFIVEDGLLRASLWDSLGGVAIYTGAQTAGYAPRRLQLSDGPALEAPLLIGAEGADSRLREWAGIEPAGWSYPQRSIVCHVATELPHGGTAYQRFLPNGPLAFLPLSDGRSSIVWSTEQAEAEELLKLDDEAFCGRLAEAFGRRLGDVIGVTPRLSFPLRLLHAQEYVRPGLALVGDSAHVIHPLAGQGINLGLADAQALAEVLAEARAQRKPLGSLRQLQRYERRRKAENLEVMALTDALYRLFRQRAPAWEAVRGLGLSLVAAAGPVKRALARRAMGLDATQG